MDPTRLLREACMNSVIVGRERRSGQPPPRALRKKEQVVPNDNTTPSLQLFAIEPEGLRELALPSGARSLHDLFLGLPPGVYEGFRTFDHVRFVGLEHHFERALSSIQRAGLEVEFDTQAVRAAIDRAARESPWPETRMRVEILGQAAPELGTQSRYLLGAEPFPALAAELQRKGIPVTTTRVTRDDPLVKSSAWAVERRKLERGDQSDGAPQEHIMVDADGRLLEGISSNFYIVRRGVVYTAGRDVLPGITRRIVAELCSELVVPLRHMALHVDELETFDEAFLTSASRGIVPVVRVDETLIGSGEPGPMTRRLIARYDDFVARRARPAVPSGS